MEQIRIKLDLPFEYVLRLAVAIDNDAHECEKMVQFYEEKGKPAHSKFYEMLARKARMIKDELGLQIKGANAYIEGDEEEEDE